MSIDQKSYLDSSCDDDDEPKQDVFSYWREMSDLQFDQVNSHAH